MTVLGLLLASFITQGQPFLPTFSNLFTMQSEKIEQGLIYNQRSSISISVSSHQSSLFALKRKSQKILCLVAHKISWQGSHRSIEKLQKKVAFSDVSKTASINGTPLTLPHRSFRLNLRKEWDVPQRADYDEERRLLAQYYQGQQLPVLRYGNTGSAVRVLQTLLTYNRYGVGISGRFDVLTETAVKAFQTHRRLAADGIVGPRTWQELTKRTRFKAKSRDPMEIPMFSDLPPYPPERTFRGNLAELTLSI